MGSKNKKKVHKIKEYIKYESEFEKRWNDMDKFQKSDWLRGAGFRVDEGFESWKWLDLKRSIRKIFRSSVFNSILEDHYIQESGCACVCCRRGFPHLSRHSKK